MTDLTDFTDPTPIVEARMLADVCTASRVLAEAIRGHRAGGPLTGFELVRDADLTDHGLALAAVGALSHTIERLCAKADEKDVEAYLDEWLDRADRDEKVARAHLAELTQDPIDPTIESETQA